MKVKEEVYQWIYSPKEDITVYELSIVLKAFINTGIIDTFPPEVQRHFKKQTQKENVFIKE